MGESRLLVYLSYGWSPARLGSRCPAGALALRLSDADAFGYQAEPRFIGYRRSR
jgi:hypothetical protein